MLSLTQRQAVKTAVLADPIASAFRAAGNGFSLLEWLNADSAISVWRTEVPVSAIRGAMTWVNFTPNDAPDGTTLWLNRSQIVLIKQNNLLLMLQGLTTVDASDPDFRLGLRDAVINLPTGALGAPTTAGGAGGSAVLTACTRLAKTVEAILASAPVPTGPVTASVLTFEGSADESDSNWLINN